MAAFKNGTSGGGKEIYLDISGGKIIREWKDKPKEEWVPQGFELLSRVIGKGPNEGTTRYYIEYDGLSGDVLDINLDKTEHGNRIAVTITDEGEVYKLRFNMFGSYGESFLLRMENIDLSKPLTFVPWLMTPEDWYKLTGKSTKNNKSGLTLKQDGEKINPYYDKENPNGMPEFKKKTVKGEVKWDTDDRDDFLFNKFVAFCDKAKNIVVAKPARTVNAPTEALVSAADDFDLDDDDLPF